MPFNCVDAKVANSRDKNEILFKFKHFITKMRNNFEKENRQNLEKRVAAYVSKIFKK